MKKIINPWIGIDGYNCFGCCPTNDAGIKMEFYEDGDEIVSFWQANEHYQSYLNTLHGGIQATLIDEIAGWVVFHKLQTIGVTNRLNVVYKKALHIDEKAPKEETRKVKLYSVSSYDDREPCYLELTQEQYELLGWLSRNDWLYDETGIEENPSIEFKRI